MNDDKELIAVFIPDHLLGSQQANLQVISLRIKGEKIPLNEPVSHYIAEGKEHDVTAFIHNTGFLKGEGIVTLTLRIKNNKSDKEVSENQSVSLAGYSGQTVTFSDVTGNLKEENNPYSLEISTMHSSISGDLYVDGTKPEVSINSITTEYLSKDGTLAIDYETTDDLSGLCQTDITILNNKGETVLIDKITNGSGTLEYACSRLDSLKNGGNPEEGSYLIIIVTVDKAGNTKRFFMDNTFTVDTTPPETVINSFNSEKPIYKFRY